MREQIIDLLLDRYGIENDGTMDDTTFATFQRDECERLAADILALVDPLGPPVSGDGDGAPVSAEDVLAELQDEMFCECGVIHFVTMKPEAVLAALREACGGPGAWVVIAPDGRLWNASPLGRGAKSYPLNAHLYEVEGSTDGE